MSRPWLNVGPMGSLALLSAWLLLAAPSYAQSTEPTGGEAGAESPGTDEGGYDYADDDEYEYEDDEQQAVAESDDEFGDDDLGDYEIGDPDQFRSVEEIVVTSQGRAQPLQEVSVSVAAFDADYMEALGAQNIADISQFTPNLEIRSVFSASNPTLFIRGVGLRDFNANSASAVAVYNDDVYMNSPAGQLGQLFDVQQVEVLRGPQGTLYGRNASAGAIRVITRKPTGVPGGYLRATYGRFNQAEVEGAVESPLVGDKLSVRIAGRMNKRDGTALNRCADPATIRAADANVDFANSRPGSSLEGQLAWRSFSECYNNDVRKAVPLGQAWIPDQTLPDPNTPPLVPLRRGFIDNGLNAVIPTDIERRVNDTDNWALRSIIRFQPNLDMDWNLNVHGSQNNSLARQFQMIPFRSDPVTGLLTSERSEADVSGYADPDNLISTSPGFGQPSVQYYDPAFGDPYAGDYNRTEPELLRLAGAGLVGDIYMGNWTLHSVTGWEWNERQVGANIDANPYIALELELGNSANQLSQELRWLWDGGGSVTAQFGAFFLYEDLEVDNRFQNTPTTASFQNYTQETYAGSAYGYGTWEASERLTIEGGVRFNVDHKALDLTTRAAPILDPGAVVAQRASAEVTEWSPTGDISFNYSPVDDVNLYMKYSRGWKGPHLNGGVLTAGEETSSGESLIKPVKPESVNALEIGWKTLIYDNRVRFNTAFFYYDYENIQIFQLKNSSTGLPVQELLNANDADNFGLEAELDLYPLEGWAPEIFEPFQLFVSFAWLEAKYTDFVNVKINLAGGNSVPITENNSGNRLINAPKLAFSGFTRWPIDLGGRGTLIPRLDWAFKDKVYFSPTNEEPLSQDAFWLLNCRIAYKTPNDAIEIAGWVRNLTNEIYRVDVINLSAFRGSVLYAIGDPRTYGLSVQYNF